jgi:hypothetical protein
MKTWHIAALLLMLFLLALGTQIQREPFVVAFNDDIPLSNTGTKIWERHPINSTPYLQLSPAYQRGLRHHANAAYFEVDNYTFDMALQKRFAFDCNKTSAILAQPWGSEIPVDGSNPLPTELNDQYPRVIEYLKKNVSPFQIVHDRWLSYKRSTNDAKLFLITLEVLLYRSGKFQGKHVNLTVLVNVHPITKNKFVVVQTRVEGVVSEDQIAMFPVTPLPPNSDEYMAVPVDPMQNYPSIMFSEDEVKKIESQQIEKTNRAMASQLYII